VQYPNSISSNSALFHTDVYQPDYQCPQPVRMVPMHEAMRAVDTRGWSTADGVLVPRNNRHHHTAARAQQDPRSSLVGSATRTPWISIPQLQLCSFRFTGKLRMHAGFTTTTTRLRCAAELPCWRRQPPQAQLGATW
jgi:hypothetical protein